MSLSLTDLWKNARDEDIVDALSKWDSTNEEAQRALSAEVKRRGLDVVVPEITAGAATAPSGEAKPWNAKVMLILTGVFAAIGAVAFLVE
jgi:hypothetical protein